MKGLNLTVSNCSLAVYGWQQTSCASGNLLLQALSGPRGTVSYQIVWNGAGTNPLSNSYYLGGDDVIRMTFTLGVATNQPGSKVSAATLTTVGPGYHDCWPFCGSDITASQRFSAAAGGGHLTADLLSSPTDSLTLTKASSFSIYESLTMGTSGFNQFMEECDPDTLNLGSVRQTFTTSPEPAAITLLLTGLAGLTTITWRGGVSNRVRASRDALRAVGPHA